MYRRAASPDSARRTFWPNDAARADREGLLEHDHPLAPRERRAHLVERPRPEALDGRARRSRRPRRASRRSTSSIVPSTEPERDDDRLGVLARGSRAPARRTRARSARRSRRRSAGSRRARASAWRAQVADLEVRLGPDHRADRHRLVGVEHLARLERRQEGVDLLLRRDVDALVGVGEDEAVHAHHHRERELLGEPERLDVQVERLLVGLGVELDPAGVALGHRVRVVVPDVDRRADRAVGHRHHDRQAEAGGVVERLDHVEQALAGGRRVGAGAGGGGADRDRHRRELRLDVDVLAGRRGRRASRSPTALRRCGSGARSGRRR